VTSGVAATGSPAPTHPDNALPVGELEAAIKELVAAQSRPTAAGGHTPGTTAAATSKVAVTAAVTTTSPYTAIPCYVVMQEPTSRDGGRGYPGGRFGRERGRGWRGQRTLPDNAGPPQPLDPTAPAHQPAAAATEKPTPGYQKDGVNLKCQQCGRRHDEGDCHAINALCFNCGNPGHFVQCCLTRTQ